MFLLFLLILIIVVSINGRPQNFEVVERDADPGWVVSINFNKN